MLQIHCEYEQEAEDKWKLCNKRNGHIFSKNMYFILLWQKKDFGRVNNSSFSHTDTATDDNRNLYLWSAIRRTIGIENSCIPCVAFNQRVYLWITKIIMHWSNNSNLSFVLIWRIMNTYVQVWECCVIERKSFPDDILFGREKGDLNGTKEATNKKK